jgi:type I restriction enzyme M protein
MPSFKLAAIKVLRELKEPLHYEDIYQYFEIEVKPHVSDAWINKKVRDHKDGKIGKIGYEINFNKYFYKCEPPRSLEKITADIMALKGEIEELLERVEQ